MKTLKQILQEQKSGEYTRPAFSKVLGQVQSDEKKALLDLFPDTAVPDIYKFNPRIEKNNNDASEVVNLFIVYTGNVLNKYPNQPVLVKQVKDKWYFMYLPAEMKSVTDKFHPNTLIPDLKNAKNNKYYKLSGLSNAVADVASSDKEKNQTEAEINKNREKWNQFIPIGKYYELDDESEENINKIRQLVGLTGKNSKFDDALQTQLKAWQTKQKFKKTEITGKWDEKTEEQFIKLLQDTDYEFRDTQITDLVTKTNLNPKPKKIAKPKVIVLSPEEQIAKDAIDAAEAKTKREKDAKDKFAKEREETATKKSTKETEKSKCKAGYRWSTKAGGCVLNS